MPLKVRLPVAIRVELIHHHGAVLSSVPSEIALAITVKIKTARHHPAHYREGEIGAGDEIVKVADGPEHVVVQEIDGLLYLPDRTPDQLQRALRVPALSAGWKGSLAALAAVEEKDGHSGNAGLAPSSAPLPMWRGFRSLRVAAIQRESVDVLSFVLGSEDRKPLPTPLPGQFLIFKLKLDKDSDPILRSYSMSLWTSCFPSRLYH